MGRPVGSPSSGSDSAGPLEENVRRLQASSQSSADADVGAGPSTVVPGVSGSRSEPVQVPESRGGNGSSDRWAHPRVADLASASRLGSSPMSSSSPKASSPKVTVSGFAVGQGSTGASGEHAIASNLSRTPSANGLLKRTLSRDVITSELQSPSSPLSSSAASGSGGVREAAAVTTVREEAPQPSDLREGDELKEEVGGPGPSSSPEGVLVPVGRSAIRPDLSETRASVASPVPIPLSHVSRGPLHLHERRESLTVMPSPSMSPLNPLSRASFSSSLLSSPSPTRGPACPPSPSRSSFGQRSPGELSRLLLGTFEQSLMISSASRPPLPFMWWRL